MTVVQGGGGSFPLSGWSHVFEPPFPIAPPHTSVSTTTIGRLARSGSVVSGVNVQVVPAPQSAEASRILVTAASDLEAGQVFMTISKEATMDKAGALARSRLAPALLELYRGPEGMQVTVSSGPVLLWWKRLWVAGAYNFCVTTPSWAFAFCSDR